eukprot:g5960.t1
MSTAMHPRSLFISSLLGISSSSAFASTLDMVWPAFNHSANKCALCGEFAENYDPGFLKHKVVCPELVEWRKAEGWPPVGHPLHPDTPQE